MCSAKETSEVGISSCQQQSDSLHIDCLERAKSTVRRSQEAIDSIMSAHNDGQACGGPHEPSLE